MRAVRTRAMFMVAVMLGMLLGLVPITALAAPGDLDPTFDTDGRLTTDFGGGTDLGVGVAAQADGKVVAVGPCTIAGSFDFCIARYNAEGGLDPTFGTGGKVTTAIGTGSDRATRVAIQPDGRIVVVGTCQTGVAGNPWDACLARYTTTGALDGSFGTGGKVMTDVGQDETGGLVALHDGKILLGVSCTVLTGGEADPCFARYNGDGTLDTTFDEVNNDGKTRWDFGTTCWLNAMAVGSDGRIYGASQCTGATTTEFHVARYTAVGTLEETDAPNITATTDVPYAAALQPDGKLIVAGACNANATTTEICLIRYGLDTELTLDPTFSTDGLVLTSVTDFRDIAVGLGVQAGGRIVAAGRCEVAQNLWDFCALRYLADGSLDTSFAGDGIVTTDFASSSDQAISSAMHPDGRLVLVGQCGAPPVDFCLARYQSDDATPPVVTITIDAADTQATTGWYNAATSGTDGVRVHVLATDQTAVTSISCTDGAASTLSIPGPSGSFTLGDGMHSITCEASDGTNIGAGPGSTAQPVEIDVDQTAPTVACFDPTLILNATPSSVSIADIDDATSGTLLTTWFENEPNTSTPGVHPVLVAVDDNAGNLANRTCGYRVAYDFDGYHAPISSGSFDYANAVAGRLIPFRFTLRDALGQPVTSIPAGVTVAVATGTCTGTSTTLAASDYPKGKGGLSNLGNGTYEFRWKASNKIDRGQCRLISLTLADGVAHPASIQFAP